MKAQPLNPACRREQHEACDGKVLHTPTVRNCTCPCHLKRPKAFKTVKQQVAEIEATLAFRAEAKGRQTKRQATIAKSVADFAEADAVYQAAESQSLRRAADATTAAEWPTKYRTERGGVFVVTANVPGVGRIAARHRFLWEANVACREMVAHALAARPEAMF